LFDCGLEAASRQHHKPWSYIGAITILMRLRALVSLTKICNLYPRGRYRLESECWIAG
jgi:hypothetical protein